MKNYVDSARMGHAVDEAKAAVLANLAQEYSTTGTYAVGDYALHAGTLYECNTPITTAEAWTAAHWTAVKIAPEVADLKNAIDDLGDFVGYETPEQLADADDMTTKGKVSDSDGVISTGSGYSTKCSGYIDITGYDKITYTRMYIATSSAPSNGMAFYKVVDGNKVYISGIKSGYNAASNHVELYTANVPQDATYAAFTYFNSSSTPFAVYGGTGPDAVKTIPEQISEIPNNVVSVPFENGAMFIETGATGHGYSLISQYRRSAFLVEINGAINIELNASDVDYISTLSIYEYGLQNGTIVFLQRQQISTISSKFTYSPGSSVKYIKFAVGCESTGYNRVFSPAIIYSNKITRIIKNPNIYNDSDKIIRLLYNVSDGQMTSGQLMLPPNYTVDGKPVPLLVYCHGTGGYDIWDRKMTLMGSIDLTDEFTYWTNEGFAVFDCYPWTTKYYSDSKQISPFIVAPNTMSYGEGVKYICSHYNVNIDEVCVSGLSLGGQMAYWFSMQTEIPVKAIAMMAPSGGWISQRYDDYFLEKNARAVLVNVLGLSGETNASTFVNTSNGLRNATVRQFVNDHLDAFAGLSPSALGSVGASYKDRFDWENDTSELVRTLPQWMQELNLPAIPDGYLTSVDGVNIGLPRDINHPELSKISLYPVKYWQAFDDVNVSAHFNYTIYTWLKNGGSKVYWRTLANGHGGHGATGYGQDAEREDVTTRLGIAMTDVAVAQKEMIDFFYDQITG